MVGLASDFVVRQNTGTTWKLCKGMAVENTQTATHLATTASQPHFQSIPTHLCIRGPRDDMCGKNEGIGPTLMGEFSARQAEPGAMRIWLRGDRPGMRCHRSFEVFLHPNLQPPGATFWETLARVEPGKVWGCAFRLPTRCTRSAITQSKRNHIIYPYPIPDDLGKLASVLLSLHRFPQDLVGRHSGTQPRAEALSS